MAQGFTRGVPIDTDPTLSLDSDLVVPSQKAIKDYVDTGLNTKQDTITLTTTGTSGAATLTGATLNIPQYGGGSVTSVSATVPSPTNPAFSVAVPNPTTTPSIDITANGIVSQYIRGDGSLATFPTVGLGTVLSVSATVPSPTSPALSVNVLNPTTTPAIAITANGTSSQLIRGDGSLALIPSFPVAAKFYQQDNWSAVGLNNSSIEYVASLNKLYVTNFSSNTVSILNATTGEPIATVAATNCVKCKYIASVNQIYVTSSSATTIIRIDGTTNLPLAAISVSVTANGVDILEYSASKVFITCGNASGSIMVVNPLLGTVAATVTTSVPSFPYGMALNTNVSSLQFDKIVIGAQSGICIFDPTTNTISTAVANPSSAINLSRFLVYSDVDDKYYVSSFSNSRLVVLSIATATTFTATFLSNQQSLFTIAIDQVNDYLFMFPLWSSGGTNIAAKMFKKTTLEPIVTITPLSQGGAGGVPAIAVIDITNSRLFLVARNASLASVSILKYV